MKDIRAAAVQFEHAPSDKAANWRKIERFVQRAAQQGVEILAFPECCITGYWHLRKLSREDLVALAEPVFDGPSSQRLSALAQQTGMTIGAGLVEIDCGRDALQHLRRRHARRPVPAPPQAALLHQRAHGLRLRVHRL